MRPAGGRSGSRTERYARSLNPWMLIFGRCSALRKRDPLELRERRLLRHGAVGLQDPQPGEVERVGVVLVVRDPVLPENALDPEVVPLADQQWECLRQTRRLVGGRGLERCWR